MLDAVPDLRPSLKAAGEKELSDLLDAFDVAAIYDKANRTLELAAHDHARTRPRRRKDPAAQRAVGEFWPDSIAGAGFEPATFGL